MKVKIKKLNENAVIPTYAKQGDAGLDLTAVEVSYDEDNNLVYKTGLAFEIPEGYVGLLFPRSSNSKTDLYLTNHVGVVDSSYRGEVILKYRVAVQRQHRVDFEGSHTGLSRKYEVGERVGQIIILPIPYITLTEVDTLSETQRGDTGFGSSGK